MEVPSGDMTDNTYHRQAIEENEAGASPAAANATAANGEPTANATITNEERYRRLSALIKRDMDPSLVWSTLERHGWVCKRGTGLVNFYYVCSKYAHESIGFITKNAKRGDEYFCSEDEVREFCREKLGWVGCCIESAKCNGVGAPGSEDDEGEEDER